MTIHVRLFAVLRDITGVNRFDIELDGDATVQTACDAIVLKYPMTGKWRDRIAFAVNQSYCNPDQSLQHDDELALIPPVSGG